MAKQEVQKKEAPFTTLYNLLEKQRPELSKVVPRHLTAERLTRVFLTACKKNPKLLNCTTTSLLKAFMDAGEIGLEPDGINAHIIPYGTEAKYQTDYKGLIKLAMMSGEVSYMTADAVYEKDIFEHEYGSNQHLKHIKSYRNRGLRVAAYSYVKYKDGSEDFKVLTADDVERARNCSKAKNSKESPWNTHPDPMWAKTAVNQHSKFLPKPRLKLLQNAAILDEKIDMDLKDVIPDKIVTKTQDKTDKLKEKLGNKPGGVEILKDTVEQTFHEKLLDIKREFVGNGGGLEEFNNTLAFLGVDDPEKLSQINDSELQSKILEHFRTVKA